jgi:hypothetical protein
MAKQPGKRSQQQNDALAPLPPINVAATNVGTNRPFNNGAASVSFSMPANSATATLFTVSAAATGQTTRTATGASSPVVVQNLASAVTYTIRVTAANADGTSPVSSSVTAAITTVPATPNAPTIQNFAGSQLDRLTWVAPATGGSALTTYFYESTDNKSGSGPASTKTFDIAQEGGTSQQYKIRVSNANGASAFSALSTTNTTPPFFPPFFPFFPPFFPFFPFFPPSFPFFPFFPPSFPFFPFFPFFPPRFPFFPFFPPRFPFFPFFPPRFPFFPFFPPRFRCIHEDTLIETSNGPVAAKDLKVGDKVLSVSIEEIDNSENTPVEFTFGNLLTLGSEGVTETEIVKVEEHLDKTDIIYFNEDSSAKYSNEHPMFIRSGDEYHVKIVKNLKIGDFLIKINKDGSHVEEEIRTITNLTENSKVYEFSCSPYKWFIAGGYLVHNLKV